jgi:hypothetical protein
MPKVPELLADGARALAANGGPEVWRSSDGATCVIGPMSSPFAFLYVMLFFGPDAANRVHSHAKSFGRSAGEEDFVVISDLTAEVGQPALLVERLPGGPDVNPAA